MNTPKITFIITLTVVENALPVVNKGVIMPKSKSPQLGEQPSVVKSLPEVPSKPTDKYRSNQTFKQGQFKTLLMPCKDCVELSEGVYRCEKIERQSLWEFTHTLTLELSPKRIVI